MASESDRGPPAPAPAPAGSTTVVIDATAGVHPISPLVYGVNAFSMDYVPWLLKELKAYDTSQGQRLLDVFSLHYYPQGGEDSDDVSTAMQQRRNRSTRSMWDPSYVDESWINTAVQLVPTTRAPGRCNAGSSRAPTASCNWDRCRIRLRRSTTRCPHRASRCTS